MGRVYISCEAGEMLKKYLICRGHEIVAVEKSHCVYSEIAAHADIYFCKLGADDAAPVFRGDPKRLGFSYPGNIIYNAAVFGKYLMHHFKYTDSTLFSAAEEYIRRRYDCPPVLIQTTQGYTKCNTVIVDDCHIITEDVGIARALRKAAPETELKVLLITPKQVQLAGFPHGFLGGASGRIGDTSVFHGDLSQHSDFQRIYEFICGCGLKVQYFEGKPLTDIGSIIYEETCDNSDFYSASGMSESLCFLQSESDYCKE